MSASIYKKTPASIKVYAVVLARGAPPSVSFFSALLSNTWAMPRLGVRRSSFCGRVERP
jgi:hypothetical protein